MAAWWPQVTAWWPQVAAPLQTVSMFRVQVTSSRRQPRTTCGPGPADTICRICPAAAAAAAAAAALRTLLHHPWGKSRHVAWTTTFPRPSGRHFRLRHVHDSPTILRRSLSTFAFQFISIFPCPPLSRLLSCPVPVCTWPGATAAAGTAGHAAFHRMFTAVKLTVVRKCEQCTEYISAVYSTLYSEQMCSVHYTVQSTLYIVLYSAQLCTGAAVSWPQQGSAGAAGWDMTGKKLDIWASRNFSRT